MAMKVLFEDQEWDLDFEKLELRHARFLKNQLGLNFKQLMAGLRELDPDALAGIYWLMKAQNNKVVDINRIAFEVFPFFEAVTSAMVEEAENPTRSSPSESDETPPENPKT